MRIKEIRTIDNSEEGKNKLVENEFLGEMVTRKKDGTYQAMSINNLNIFGVTEIIKLFIIQDCPELNPYTFLTDGVIEEKSKLLKEATAIALQEANRLNSRLSND